MPVDVKNRGCISVSVAEGHKRLFGVGSTINRKWGVVVFTSVIFRTKGCFARVRIWELDGMKPEETVEVPLNGEVGVTLFGETCTVKMGQAADDYRYYVEVIAPLMDEGGKDGTRPS